MKPRAMFWLPIVLLLGTGWAHSQGVGGSMGNATNGGAWGQGGSASRSASQSSQTWRTFSTPNASRPAPRQPSRAAGSVFIDPSRRPGFGFAAIGPSGFHIRLPFGGFARPPFIHHVPLRFRQPGIIIVEGAGFVGTGLAGPSFSTYGWTAQRPLEVWGGDPRVRSSDQLAPFDPTPQEVVERMLALATVREGDVVYDLGSGDGRIVIAAAKNYGVKAVGFEIDPGLVKLARENARREGVEKLVDIRQQDFMTIDFSPATVVTLYLSYDGNLAVRPKLTRELKPGSRVISYAFDMGDWQSKVVESYRDAAGDKHLLYVWQISDPQSFSQNANPAAE